MYIMEDRQLRLIFDDLCMKILKFEHVDKSDLEKAEIIVKRYYRAKRTIKVLTEITGSILALLGLSIIYYIISH